MNSSTKDAMTMGARLDQYLQDRHISQAELERLSGVKQQTISYLIRTNAKSSSYAIRIATALGINPVWLQEGQGNPNDPAVAVGAGAGVSAVRSHWVPMLSMNNEVATFLQSGEAPPDARRIPAFDVGERSFAMEVAGRSMEPDLSSGDEVVIDPAVLPEPGDFVIADCSGTFMLRKYRAVSSENFELIPANPDFPTVRSSDTPGCRVVGTVVERRQRLKRARAVA